MRVTMLGTGSADGWPNPFCDCGSCTAERSAGRSRAPSSALVDGRLLIDCGPTTPHLPAGSTLRDVEHVLLTHGHPDHLHPAFLLTRSWVSSARPLHVWGPTGAIDLCRPWLAPDSDVVLHVLSADGTALLPTDGGTYSVHALAAEHDHGRHDALALEALVFVVTGPAGERLLYATDTGPLAADTVAKVAGSIDVMVVDETFGDRIDHGTGHLDLSTLPPLLARLRSSGVLRSDSVVVATHLSHHNPPTRQLQARLAAIGVTVVDDHCVVDTDGPPARRVLVLGGARSGKSTHAEQLASTASEVVYVATGGERSDDPEWTARVALHRSRRPGHWRTVETTDIPSVLDAATAGSLVLVDCLALWLTAVLDALDAWPRLADGHRSDVEAEAMVHAAALVSALATCAADVVLVSNEVGMGIVPSTPAGRLFRDLLGRVNIAVAEACDQTVLVVAGRPVALGGVPTIGGGR